MALRPVEIAIRAKDQTKAGVKSATNGLERFAAAQAKTNSRRRQIADMENDAQGLATAYRQAADRANELGQQIANAKRPSKALRDEFVAVRGQVKGLRDDAIQAAAALGRTTGQVGARGSFAQFDQIASGAKRAEIAIEDVAQATGAQASAALAAASSLRNHEAAVNEVAAAEAHLLALQRNASASAGALVAAQNRVAAAYNARATAATVMAAAQKRADLASQITGAYASKTGRGPLGLRPYELQNLSYQVNDFFTQIASGTPVTQAFAQQFGQVAQLFPAAISGFIRFIPIIGLATVALAPFVTELLRVNREAKNLSTFEALLRRSGEAASYSAKGLALTAAALDEFGASAEEARKTLTLFVTDSVDPAYLERFGKAAINASKALGIDLADASEKVSTAFTGNVDAIISLDDELNFLTDSERAHILKLKESKKEAEARTYAFGVFEQRYQGTANKMKGPWSQILSDFNGAWKAFANFINFIDFSALKNDLNIILRLISRVTALLPGARSQGIDAVASRQAQVQRMLNQADSRPGMGDQRQVRALRGENLLLQNRLAIMRAQANGGLLGSPPQPGDTTLDPPAIDADKPKRSGGKSDAQEAAERRAELLEDLQASNAARAFELSLIDLQEREAKILSEIESERLKFAEEGLTLTAEQTLEIRASVGALYDAENAAKARKTIDQAALELAEARNEVEAEGAFITRKLQEAGLESIGEVDAATGEMVITLTAQQRKYSEILRDIYRINEATRQRAAAEKTVNDLTGQRSDLMEQIEFYEDAGQQSTADRLREQLTTVNSELTLAVDNAINFWTAVGGEGSEAALLRLGLLRDQLNGIGQDALFSGKQINDMIADGATNAFDQFAQSIADGQNVIGALRDAFLQFAADFLRQIAQMIIQQAILNALQASQGGGGGGGGSIASFLNSLFGSAGVKHDGGIIGAGGPSRSVSPLAFLGAMRYHSGGIIGLKPNERPIIAEDNEEMLTADDPRHRDNLRGGGSTKILNVLDGPDLLQHALSDERGQQVFFNFVRDNSGAFKAVLG